MELAITVALIAAAVSLFGIFAKHRLDLWRDKRNERIKAASVFRSTFSDSLSQIKNGVTDPFVILEENFSAHELAVIEFERHLGQSSRKKFLDAWSEYYCHENTNIRLLEQYTTTGVSMEQGRKNRALAVHRLEHLTSYAKQP